MITLLVVFLVAALAPICMPRCTGTIGLGRKLRLMNDYLKLCEIDSIDYEQLFEEVGLNVFIIIDCVPILFTFYASLMTQQPDYSKFYLALKISHINLNRSAVFLHAYVFFNAEHIVFQYKLHSFTSCNQNNSTLDTFPLACSATCCDVCSS